MILTVLAAASDAGLVAESIESSPFLESAKTWVTYAGVLATAIIVAVAGIRKALKDLKSGNAEPSLSKNKVMAATLVETHTMLAWSESNRVATEAIRELAEKLDGMCRSVNYNTEAVRDSNRESAELRHQIERIRDKMP